VDEPGSHDGVWWGGFNQPISPERYEALRARVVEHLSERDVFVQDGYVGAHPKWRRSLRAYTETAWASIFCENLFRRPTAEQLATFEADFTVIDAPSFRADPDRDGVRSETVILVHLSRQEIIIAGTEYAGEIKKGAFGIMNYRLPDEGVLPMHSSVNVGSSGDVAIFFGLSGTGKTTLSADPERMLIGDDEHGWGEDGVFNFEGGCYAKVIRLSAENEPEIYATTRRFGTILENVVMDPTSRRLDLDDDRFTENTRAAYPLDFIPNVVPDAMVQSHPKNVILLTCDAQGVLPPIARLDPEHAVYHFISGYTSKIAGTEIGLGIEPEITFSACFGAPFMVHHPFTYADLLRAKMLQHGATCWLVNTGWVGGGWNSGKRISIRHTRNLLDAALEGKLDKVKFRKDKLFGFEVPLTCPDVPKDVLEPSTSWGSKDEYWKRYDALAARYIENFKFFADGCPPEVLAAAPKRLKDVE
jgi:phosphoenolpyruvate carboxykinase (ATP)